MRKIIFILMISLLKLTATADSVTEILRTVNDNNLELKALKEQLQASGYELKSENTLDATSVEYSPFFRRGAAGVATSELIVSQEFDFPTLYYSRNKSGKLEMNSLVQQYELARRDIFQKAAESFLNYVRIEKLKAILRERVETDRKILSLYSKKLEAGDATSLEINQIQLRLMKEEAQFLTNEKERERALSELKALNGFRELPSLQAEYPEWILPGQTVEEIAGNDREVKAAESMVEASIGKEHTVRQGWLPKLTLGYRRNTEFDDSFNGFVIGAAFPLFSQSSRLKATKARKAAAEIEADKTRKKVESELSLTLKEIELINRSLRGYDMQLIEEGRRLLDKSLESGAMTLTDYYSRQEEINEKLEGFINLQYEYYSKLCVLYRNQLTTITND